MEKFHPYVYHEYSFVVVDRQPFARLPKLLHIKYDEDLGRGGG
jgi:hypothetical protein